MPVTASAEAGTSSAAAGFSAWPGRAEVPEYAFRDEDKAWAEPKIISLVGSTGSIGTQVRERARLQRKCHEQ